MTLLYLSSDQMGQGNEELGKKLMKSFLKNLAESDEKVDLVGCVNSGVFLTAEGSEVVDYLKKIEEKGAQIASCGTCLDYFDLREKLLIGQVGTMEMSVKAQFQADKIIRP